MTAELAKLNPFVEVQALYRERRGSGDQWLFRFGNGYGASVIQGPHSYGGTKGLYEMAVIEWTGSGEEDFEITYDTPITEDVLGYQTIEEIRAALLEVAELPAQVGAS